MVKKWFFLKKTSKNAQNTNFKKSSERVNKLKTQERPLPHLT